MTEGRRTAAASVRAGGAPKARAIQVRDSLTARIRLFCLPYAGGGASLFRPWVHLFPPAIHVCPVQLPGREERLHELPHTSLGGVVDDLMTELLPLVDRPFALFGHSLGATLAFELACELRRCGVAPVWLFVAAGRAPHRPSMAPRLSTLSDPMLLDAVQRKYGGVPDAVRQSTELLQLLVPVLRADLAILETYQYRDEPPLECPISCFAGADDRAVAEDELRAWRERTVGLFEYTTLPGGHFFVKDSRSALLRAIGETLQSTL